MEKNVLVIVWKISAVTDLDVRDDGKGVDIDKNNINYIGSIRESKIRSFVAEWIRHGVGFNQIAIFSGSGTKISANVNQDDIGVQYDDEKGA